MFKNKYVNIYLSIIKEPINLEFCKSTEVSQYNLLANDPSFLMDFIFRSAPY